MDREVLPVEETCQLRLKEEREPADYERIISQMSQSLKGVYKEMMKVSVARPQKVGEGWCEISKG